VRREREKLMMIGACRCDDRDVAFGECDGAVEGFGDAECEVATVE